MSQTSKDEIDLGYLINKISELFKNISVSIYNSIQFCLRNWYFIVGLLIGGIVLGYFSEIDSKPEKKATLILRTNFNTAEYTYNALNTLMVKSKTLDTAFLKQHGFKTLCFHRKTDFLKGLKRPQNCPSFRLFRGLPGTQKTIKGLQKNSKLPKIAFKRALK